MPTQPRRDSDAPASPTERVGEEKSVAPGSPRFATFRATMQPALSRSVGGAPAWAIVLLGTAAVVLVPWSVALTSELPAHHVARHWDVAWAGFDAGLAMALLATVVAAVRGSRWLSGLAVAAAAMILCDAWFDVVTSASRLDLWLALASAVVVELPLALACIVVSRSALHAGRD